MPSKPPTPTPTLRQVLEDLPASSKARRQYRLAESALEALEEALTDREQPDSSLTLYALYYLRAATDQTEELFQ